jgi:glucose-6-phosphate 1-dehydrogenase
LLLLFSIDNDRWSGVPFILKAGKALDERKAEIRIQLRSTPHFVFEADPEEMRNEIVVRLQPNEAIYAKLIVKSPGLDTHPVISDLDLTLKHRHPTAVIPDAYPKLILDAIRGDQQHFVRRDELRAAWAIITPLLEDIDSGKLPLHDYPHGSRGPARADEILKKVGFVKNRNYKWK